MKLLNSDVFFARDPLGKLLDQKFPVKVSYGLAKLTNKLNEQLKVIDDTRNGLIKKYGAPDERGALSVQTEIEKDVDGKKVREPNPNFPKFAEEFTELMAQEFEIVFDKVKIPEKVTNTCNACHNTAEVYLQIEPSVMIALDKFLEVI